jgi:ATP-binding cassette, subfamily F, member 3
MILLSVRDVVRRFDAEPVLKNVGFEVRAGERIGLVGPNGAGKTTLLNILVGEDDPDTGVVEKPQAVEIALLEQQLEFPPDRTLIQEARSGLGHLYELQERSHDLAHRLAAEKDPAQLDRLHKQFDNVQHELDRLDAYNIDHRVDEVLHGLGFEPEQYGRPLASFSGGQQNRVVLARLLLRAPDVMLLDEPTNHLDIAATEWLETYLTGCPQAVILVSHDRYFLDRVTTRTFELMSGRLTDYAGNFTTYRRQRDERVKVLQRTFDKQQEFIAKTEDFIRRNKAGQKHAQAVDREKKLARLETVDRPPEEPSLSMTFGEPERTGDWVIDAVGLEKGFGTPLFTDFTLRVHRGDRIGIFGPNGSGKTTLLRTLLGELEPDAGSVRIGTGVKIGYYDQQLSSVDPELDAIEASRPMDNLSITPGYMRSLLGRFGLSGEIVFQKVGSLSGGEKSRVALTKIAAASVNVLILDEPTNHLDLWARDALETALRNFDGTLLFVSHDRYFLDRLATNVIVFTDGGWKHYHGNYSDFVGFTRNIASESRQNPGISEIPGFWDTPKAQSKPEPSNNHRPESNQKRRRRFPYRKVDDLEQEIAEWEDRKEQLQTSLADPDLHRDGNRVKETMAAFAETETRLKNLYEHWEEAIELN